MRGLGHSGPVNCMTEMTSAVGASAKGDWIVTGGVDHNLMVSASGSLNTAKLERYGRRLF